MKRLFSFYLLVSLFFIFAVPAAAAKEYPYDRPDLYKYEISSDNSYMDGGNIKIDLRINVTDLNVYGKVYSNDKISITLHNPPFDQQQTVEESALQDFEYIKNGNTVKRTAGASYRFNGRAYYEEEWTWDSFVDYITKRETEYYNYTDAYEIKETTIGGHKALLVIDSTFLNNDYDNTYGDSYEATYYICYEDVPLPRGILYTYGVFSINTDGWATEDPDTQQRIMGWRAQKYDDYFKLTENLMNQMGSMQVTYKKTSNTGNTGLPTGEQIDTDASQTAGETSATIPAVIVLGVSAAAAAAAGAGAAGASSDSNGSAENKEEEKKASYKMYVYKDFGNSIRYDKPAVTVYARMAQVSPEGVETQRPDLTAQITIFSPDSHMKIGTPCIAGDYMGATAEAESVKGSSNPTEGVISFRFNGTGGSFQNNVTFQLVGDPYIKFAKPNGESLNVLLGDDGCYESEFKLVDFMDEPKVRLKPLADSFPFEMEAVHIENRSYKLSLQNHSAKPEKPVVTPDVYKFELFAENDKEADHSIITITLYPEGLSIRGINFDNEGYAKIGAYADKEQSEGEEAILATHFIVDLAVGRTDAKGKRFVELVDVSTAQLEIGKLKGTETQTQNLAKVFTYETKAADHGSYKFQPKMQIPEMKGFAYHLHLPLSCNYEGRHYALDMPVRLIGEPFNEMKEKQEELRLLLARVRRYMPSEEWSGVVRFMKERFDAMSAREIRLMDRSLIEITQKRLLLESKQLQDFAKDLDWVIGKLEWVKWTGDQAFSILMTIWTGPIGEAILVPAKEIVVAFLAEYASEVWLCNATLQSQDQMTRGIRSNLSAMLENTLMSQIDTKNLDMRKLGKILAAFAVLKTLNHYFNDVDGDGKPVGFLDAILSTFSDLTVNVFKLAFQQKFEQFVDNKTVNAVYEKYCKDWLKKLLDSRVGDWQTKGVEVVQKYLTELLGEGCAWAYNKLSSKAGQTTISQNSGDFVMTLNLWDYDAEEKKDPVLVDINITKLKDKLIDYIFDAVFAVFPFPSSAKPIPGDPPFYSSNPI